MKVDVNFFEHGNRMVEEFRDIQQKVANEIEEKYGKDARMEFECGIASAIDVRENDSIFEVEDYKYDDSKIEEGIRGFKM